ncbi:outer membrane beta-barrel family protein [Hufsiella ginkgonis]|uniref:TonB-dependent receptor n=1 Tax=Hufsiella ginkgonis TaxID=2695274 RepID=A0A7K1XTM1_9SPHI|nr:outer membrane beta-barrel family protein [Hufsiella ginkgonis]MXV14355.1 TonB-dependent receptor [Hufsiella ginkgonis]
MKTYTLLMLMLAGPFLAKNCAAQEKLAGSRVSGAVLDAERKAVDFATIHLLRAKDSSLVKVAISAADGTFIFENNAAGNYLVAASMAGYKKGYSKPFELNAGNKIVTLEAIRLPAQSRDLKEVAIVSQKPLIERKMDRLVLNVESGSLAAGATAMEVLEKAPGVTVDKDDNIAMKGKQGVTIMLDGKPTYMSNADVANMLRNMQSSQIETIELITSPSAKYDASGTSGIINIKTKKSKSLGLNGTATAGGGYGETSKMSGGTNLNYRNRKVNLFGNVNYANNGRLNTLNLNRQVTTVDTVTTFRQLNSWDNRRFSTSYKAGADFFLNKNHTIGVLINGYANKNDEESNSNTNWVNNFNQSERINILGNNTESYDNMALNLNYKGVLSASGKEISMDVDYSNYNGNHDEIRDNSYQRINLDPRGNLLVKNYAPAEITVKSFKTDYSHPINKTSKIEAGLKASLVKTDNDLLLAKFNGTTYVADPEYTNHFVYDEDIVAGYLNFSKEFKKTGVQLGLRAEQTFSKGNSVTKNEVVKRSYPELFPSVAFSRKINKDNELGLSYSRRIDRPSYDDLNPFLNFLDEYTFQKGNPFLNPQFTNSFDLSHTFKGKFTTSLSYSHTRDAMATVTEQDNATLKTYAIQKNLDEMDVYNLTVYAPVSPARWWNVNNNFQVFRMNFKSFSNGGTLNSGQTAISYNMDQSFTLSATASADLSAQYQSPQQYGIFRAETQVVLNAGVRKSLVNNKLSLRASINDIFNSRKNRLSTTYQDMNLNFVEKGESRIARLTVSYRFGKNEVRPARKRSTGSEAELNRMKN